MNDLKNKNFKKLMNSKLLYTLPLAGMGVFCTQQTSNAMYKKPVTTTTTSTTTTTTSTSRSSALTSPSSLGISPATSPLSSRSGSPVLGARSTSPTPSTSPKTYTSKANITLGSNTETSTTSISSSSTTSISSSSTSTPISYSGSGARPKTSSTSTSSTPSSSFNPIVKYKGFTKGLKDDFKEKIEYSTSQTLYNEMFKKMRNDDFSDKNLDGVLNSLLEDVKTQSKSSFRNILYIKFQNKDMKLSLEDINNFDEATNDFVGSMSNLIATEFKNTYLKLNDLLKKNPGYSSETVYEFENVSNKLGNNLGTMAANMLSQSVNDFMKTLNK